MSSSLVCKDTNIRVSSVLNRDVKQFGKQFMFDGDDETCWNSDQGTPQWVLVNLPKPVTVSELQIKFQGGFVGKECSLMGCPPGDKDRKHITDFYPEDINSLQSFPVQHDSPISTLQIVFSQSTDFFGRITIYEMIINGNKVT